MAGTTAGLASAGDLEQLLERLSRLLEQERSCLLEWQPQRLLELSLERKALQQLLLARLPEGGAGENLTRRLQELNRRNRANLRLVRAAIKVTAGLQAALGRRGGAGYGARGRQLSPAAGPLLETVA